jgi:hypothetical protein
MGGHLSIDVSESEQKKVISLTPLEVALKALILAFNDSAEALVLRLSKKFRIDLIHFRMDMARVHHTLGQRYMS